MGHTPTIIMYMLSLTPPTYNSTEYNKQISNMLTASIHPYSIGIKISIIKNQNPNMYCTIFRLKLIQRIMYRLNIVQRVMYKLKRMQKTMHKPKRVERTMYRLNLV